jgi:hypothetical protein
MPRHDPFRGFRFRLEIDGIASAAFATSSEVLIETLELANEGIERTT